MVNKLAIYLTNYIVQSGFIEEDEYKVYQYGFTVCIEILIVFLTCGAITVGGGSKLFYNGVVFWGIFIPIRKYGGGVHFKKFKHCFVVSVATYMVIIFTKIDISIEIMMPLCLILILVLFNLGPVFTKEIRADFCKQRRYKIKYRITLILVYGVVIFLDRYEKLIKVIFLTLLLEIISLILEKSKEKELLFFKFE